jgi:biopolymer transport protein ExbD
MSLLLVVLFVVQAAWNDRGRANAGATAAAPGALASPGRLAAGRLAAGIVIGISGAGTVHHGGRRMDLGALRPAITRHFLASPRPPVTVLADAGARASVITRVMEECRLAGADDVRLAIRNEGRDHDD